MNSRIQKGETKGQGSPAAADSASLSDDSASTDEGANDSGAMLVQMVKVNDAGSQMFELDSRCGLNGSKINCVFQCLKEESSLRFFVFLGGMGLDKFTKSTFLNLCSFAEKNGAHELVLIQNRDHRQKNQFRQLFQVVDAKRVGKSGMQAMLTAERMEEWIAHFALYAVELN